MEIQTRKLHLIEEVLRTNDVELIGRLEQILYADKGTCGQRSLSPMSNDEFYAMIDRGIADVKAGRVQSHESISKEVQSWK